MPKATRKGAVANGLQAVGWLHSTVETVNKVSSGGKAATVTNIADQNRCRTQMPGNRRESADGEKAGRSNARAIRSSRSRMRKSRTSGSVRGRGEQSPLPTRPRISQQGKRKAALVHGARVRHLRRLQRLCLPRRHPPLPFQREGGGKGSLPRPRGDQRLLPGERPRL